MSCRFDREIIQKYIDNSIDPLEFIFLKEHLNYCGQCKKELDTYIALENELENFYDHDDCLMELDSMIDRLVDQCMCGLNRREKLKYFLKRGVKIGRGIVDNTFKFSGYIPGSRQVGRAVRKAASSTGNLMKAAVKKKARGFLNNAGKSLIWG